MEPKPLQCSHLKGSFNLGRFSKRPKVAPELQPHACSTSTHLSSTPTPNCKASTGAKQFRHAEHRADPEEGARPALGDLRPPQEAPGAPEQTEHHSTTASTAQETHDTPGGWESTASWEGPTAPPLPMRAPRFPGRVAAGPQGWGTKRNHPSCTETGGPGPPPPRAQPAPTAGKFKGLIAAATDSASPADVFQRTESTATNGTS